MTTTRAARAGLLRPAHGVVDRSRPLALPTMGRNRRPCGVALPRGLTLVEVLLTMSLLVVLVSLVLPAMKRPLARQRLCSAADQVRSDWTRARTKAISAGKAYVFRYLPEADRYTVQPASSGESTMDETSMGGADLDASPSQESTAERVLPEGITFQGVSADQQGTGAMGSLAGDAGGGATFDSESSLAEIRFSPDGTTSTARVTLKNEYGRSIELSLRGLTGVVTMGDVQVVQETAAGAEMPAAQEAQRP